jgi:hypothetical protein
MNLLNAKWVTIIVAVFGTTSHTFPVLQLDWRATAAQAARGKPQSLNPKPQRMLKFKYPKYRAPIFCGIGGLNFRYDLELGIWCLRLWAAA